MSDYEWLQFLQTETLVCTAALLLILLVRIALLRQGNPALAYASWLLLPLAFLATLLPHPAAQMPVFGVSIPSVAISYAPVSNAAPEVVSGPWLWVVAWLSGAVIAFALMVWQQLRFRFTLGPLQSVGSGRVYRANHDTAGPLVIGLMRPRIVIPANFESRYTKQEQALILAHEQVHLQRGDLLANAFAALVQIAFWFNPLVYFAAARFRFDQELACDMAVIQQHPAQRQSYAATILKTQMSASRLPVGCHWQAHHPLKERIMQLTRPTTSPARRIAAKIAMTALALSSCYGAWAVSSTEMQTTSPPQTAPETVAPTVPAPVKAPIVLVQPKPVSKLSTPRTPAEVLPVPVESVSNPPTEAIAPPNGYQMEFTYRTMIYAGEKLSQSITSKTPALPVTPGRPVYFNLGSDEHRCNFKLDLQPYPSRPGTPSVFADLEIKCNDNEESTSHPKVVTKLGSPASIRISVNGQTAQEFTLLVTPKEL